MIGARDVKKGESAAEQSRRRQEATINIRKNKRIQNLQKRRARETAATNAAAATGTGENNNTNVNSTTNTVNNETSKAKSKGTVARVEDLPKIAATLKQMTPEQRYEATRSVRRLLSREEQPPAMSVIKAGLVPLLVAELGLITEEKTQFEAAWALTNIASTEHTRVVVEAGAVPYLVKLMMSKNPDIREQCLWCLGNVAGDGHDLRDVVLNVPGALNNLLMNIKHAATPSLLGNATWTLSNFCRGKPQPALNSIRPALPYLAKLITHNKLDIVGDACWALSYISDGDDDRIQACVDMGIIPTLVRLLQSDKVAVVTPALRTLGNIVSGNDKQTQAVMDAGAFNNLKPLMNHHKRTVRKETCWALSNIAAGTPPQVDALCAQTQLLQRTLEMLETDDFEVRKEAAWVISNICTGGNASNIGSIVALGALRTICAVIDVSDVKISLVTLEALEAILRKNGTDNVLQSVEEMGGIDKLEDLQDHTNEDIYNKALHIIDTYFHEEEDSEDDEPAAPAGAENQDPGTAASGAIKGDFSLAGFGNVPAVANTNDVFGASTLQSAPAAMDWGF